VYGDNQQLLEWRERAELHLESQDFTTLAQVVAVLREQSDGAVKLKNQHFFTSLARQQEVEAQLTKDVVALFQERANLITQEMGVESYVLVDMTLDSAGSRLHPMPQPRMMSVSVQAKSAPAVQMEAGTVELVMTARGKIKLETRPW